MALALLAAADLAFENFTPRVMGQFGLDWERLEGLNPRLQPWCGCRPSGSTDHGGTLPGFAQTMEAVTGLASMTGWVDGPPVLVGARATRSPPLHAAFAGLVALAEARAQAGAHLVEATMIEAVLNVAAAAPIARQLTGRPVRRHGNRSFEGAVPQGVYRCAGEDRWIAVSVRERPGVAELDRGPRQPGSRRGRNHGTPPTCRRRGRGHEHGDELERWLSERCGRYEAADLADRLSAAGVPAAVVVVPPEGARNPQVLHRGLFEVEDHPVTGRHLLQGLPFRLDAAPSWLRSAAPLLGQHNDEVLEELGIRAERRGELRSLGVIGERPAGL